MAHHGHYRHSRINRLIRAKHRLDANDGGIANVDDDDSALMGAVDTIQGPGLPPPDLLSNDRCDPLQNVTCLEDVLDPTEVSLSKRQAAESPQSTIVETIVQVVDTKSHTIWQSTAVDFPVTISDPAFGALTIPSSVTASTEASLPTSPTNWSTATQPTTLSAQTPAPTSKQTQTAAISSPRASSTIGSLSYTSTPLAVSSSSTSLAASTSTSTSTSVLATIYSSSSNSSTPSYSTWSFTSTSGFRGSEETGVNTGSASAPSTTDSQPSSGSGSTRDSTTPKIVGGVVGTVAGLAMLLLLAFYLLRRRRLSSQKGIQALSSDGSEPREVMERPLSNDPLFAATYLAPAFMKRWRQSTMTTRTGSTVSSSNPSERGFQKISGRKIPPVLTHGGDGYGGGLGGDSPTIPGFPPMSPRDGPFSSLSSHGPPPTSPYGMPLDTTYTRETDEHNTPTRPSPVHLPISSSVNFGTPTTVNLSHPVAQPQSAMPVAPLSPSDEDGNRGSRFTESLDL